MSLSIRLVLAFLGLAVLRRADVVPLVRLFDEVDAGLGMDAATPVALLLRRLAGECQGLCVTHLPQVAALAHHQLQVSKLSGEDTTRTRIRALDDEERIDEIARMLGGVKITRKTREHAREMTGQAQSGGK